MGKDHNLQCRSGFFTLNEQAERNLEFYNKLGSDLLANTNGVPTEGMGFSTYTINNGRMTNRGFEVTLSADVIRSSAWNWNVSGVLGYNKNKVTYVNVEAPVSYLLIDYPSAIHVSEIRTTPSTATNGPDLAQKELLKYTIAKETFSPIWNLRNWRI